MRWSPWSWITCPISSSSTSEPLHANSSVKKRPTGNESAEMVQGQLQVAVLGRERLTFECLQELLGVILLGNSLEGGDRLASVTLLNTNVDVVGCGEVGW